MNSRLRSAALAAIVFFAVGRSAHAAVIVGLVLDPATTAGSSPDVNSIYSGLGTWHLFAVDDNDDDFGISSYNIELTGATAIRHTSPSALGIKDANGDFYEAGFNTLRSANGSIGSSYIHASQPLPDQSPFLITGLGQRTGNFAAVTGGATLGGTTSSSWGNYNTISPLNGKNWLFLGEGTYNQGVSPSIAQATFTVYNNSTTFSSKLSPTAIVTEPITPALLTPEYLAHLTAPPPPPAPIEVFPVVQPAPQPVVVPIQPIDDPPAPPIENVAPHETELPVTQPDPNIGDGGWTVIRDPWTGIGFFDESVHYIEPSLLDLLPVVVGLHYPAMLSSHAYFDVDGGIRVDPVFSESMLNLNTVAVDFDGFSLAADGVAQYAATGLFGSPATEAAIPTPEPGGLFLAIASQWCLLSLASRRAI